MIAGSCYQHSMGYAGPQGGYHWNGVIVKRMLKPGDYDFELYSIKQLKKRYG